MKKDSTKNSAPIAPVATSPSASTAATAKAAMPEKGTAVAKKNKAAGGATGSTARRSNKTATSGAKYGITVKIPAYKSPEAGAVQGNGRLFSPAIKRTAPNFWDGTKVKP